MVNAAASHYIITNLAAQISEQLLQEAIQRLVVKEPYFIVKSFLNEWLLVSASTAKKYQLTENVSPWMLITSDE